MTPAGPRLGNDYLCDLCFRLRPGKLRVFGVDFIDTYWACQECIEIYDRRVAAMGRGRPNGA